MTASPLWTLDELRDVLGAAGGLETTGRLRGDSTVDREAPRGGFHGVSIDSRTVQPGDLFVAIRGDVHDGHDFVEAAIAAGAGAALVSADRAGPLQAIDLPLLIVPDAFEGLRALGRAARHRFAGKVVAVTGSVGKTSMRELIRQVLATKGKTHASVRSFNNHWGVPLTLARLPRDVQFAVIEIGMNRPGEIGPLSRMARPQVAVITHISEAHLQSFDDLSGIAAAKAEIFEGLEPDGVAVLGADHAFVGTLIEKATNSGASRVVTYGLSPNADWRADPDTASVATGGAKIPLHLRQLGTHALVNAAGALAVGDVLGADRKAAIAMLEAAKAEPGRGVIHHLGNGVTLIDESYNANPASMRAALALLAATPATGRRIAVLGDMLELGTASQTLHAELSEYVTTQEIDKVFVVGPIMRSLAAALPDPVLAGQFAEAGEAIEPVLKSLARGDVVMVKGSNGIGLSRLVAALVENCREGGVPSG